MKTHHLSVLLFAALLAGCGQSGDITPAPVSTPESETTTSLDLLEESAPSPDAPPPALGSDGSAVIATATEADLEKEMVDEEGQPLTVLKFLQQAVETYDRSRAGTETEDSDGWPELTDLSQLVKYRIISRLPPAPPGKKFVYNPQNQTVTVANQ